MFYPLCSIVSVVFIEYRVYSLGQMKKVLLFSALLLLIFPQTADANIQVSTTGDSNVTVNQETLGETTTCVNGKCTTTGGGGKTSACVNGKCYTSENGNLDIEENNGNTQVHIKSSNSNSSVKVGTDSSDSKEEIDATKAAENKKDKEPERENRTIIQVIITVVIGFVGKILSFL